MMLFCNVQLIVNYLQTEGNMKTACFNSTVSESLRLLLLVVLLLMR
jgi:hypothetical protein